MKPMKKLLCMLIAGVMAVSAAGCGSKDVKEPAAQEEVTENTEVVTEEAVLDETVETEVLETEEVTTEE